MARSHFLRRMARLCAALLLALALIPTETAPARAGLPAGGTFDDDNGNIHEPNIEAIAAEQITLGCGPRLYCPAANVSRGEMAAFLLRAIDHDGHPPPYRGYFGDVPSGQWYTGYVEHLYEHGITLGCGGGNYCPSSPVSRAEMAAFILRAIGHADHLPAYRGYFGDVPAGLWYTGYVEHLYEHGITLGCGGGNYCPDASVRRDEMASFIARALGLEPITPPQAVSFNDGTWRVGVDIPAGTYRSSAPSDFCYWERLSGFGGTSAEIIANEFTTYTTIVTIESGDAGFSSDGCGPWTNSPRPAANPASVPDGTWLVGDELPAGLYRSAAPADYCYWERLSGFSGEFKDLISNDLISYRTVVAIGSGDAGFKSDGCGPWTNDLSPITSSPTASFGDGVYLVGTDVASGTWRVNVVPDGCYWERLSGFGGDFGEIIANDLPPAGSTETVAISGTDAGFRSDECGSWVYLGP